MNVNNRRIIVLIFLLLFFVIEIANAEETEQFTLPPKELLDVGPIVSQQLSQTLEKIVAQVNAEIETLLPLEKESKRARRKLALLREGLYFSDLVYRKGGPGFPKWLDLSHLPDYRNTVIYKETRPWKTVYWLAFSQSPFSLIGLSPTIHLYDYYFGTDKLGHFFMQGHTYYKIYTYLTAHGKSPARAQEILVTYGQILEHTYLGRLVNGVYSNGDLSANFAGWKFYMNLTQAIKIGDTILPPILVLRGDRWEFQRDKENLLKPYLSDHLNEALNPSYYTFTRNQIQREVQKRCADWIHQKGITKEIIEAKLRETSLWHGEQYGHWLPAKNAITLDVCFR